MNGYRSFAVTVIGGNHIKDNPDNAVCQDFSNFCDDDDDVSITVVADGHGDSSCFRSHLGSRFAVACVTQGIKDFVKEHVALFPKKQSKFWLLRYLPKQAIPPAPSRKEFEKLIREKLIKYIVASWNKAVGEHYEKNPFTSEELEKVSEKYRKRFEDSQQMFLDKGSAGEGISKAYGTTLIAAAITPHYWFGFHIGDGRFTVLYPDKGEQPVPWDEKCFLNATTSICDGDILERDKGVRSFLSFHTENEPPLAIFLCTDGIDDNYPVDEKENKTQLIRLYRTISLTFVDDGYESTCVQLKDLINQFATKGKGDDTSIGCIINIEETKKAALEHGWKEKMEAAEEVRSRKKDEAAAKVKSEHEAAEKEEISNADTATEDNTTAEDIANKPIADSVVDPIPIKEAKPEVKTDDENEDESKQKKILVTKTVINAYQKNMDAAKKS